MEPKFKDANDYKMKMTALVQKETDCEQKQLERIEKLTLSRWEVTSPLKVFFYNNQVKAKEGDRVVLTFPTKIPDKKEWKAEGVICSTKSNKNNDRVIGVQLDDEYRHESAPTDQRFGFNLEFVWNSIPTERMINAIKVFTKKDSNEDDITRQVKAMIIKGDNAFQAPIKGKQNIISLTPLNGYQKLAVASCLTNSITLIEGSAGTGKTVVAANIVMNLYEQTKSAVLVCAPSDVSVNNLMDQVSSICGGLTVVRVKDIEKESKKKKNSPSLLGSADFVFCTCDEAGDVRLTGDSNGKVGMTFASVLIDDCNHATEPEALMPISLTKGRVVLIGDRKQLGPKVFKETNKDKESKIEGLALSLFERLFEEDKFISLKKQYRTHPLIAWFSTQLFYAKDLNYPIKSVKDGVTEEERKLDAIEWPVKGAPLIFISCKDFVAEKHENETKIVDFIVKQVSKTMNAKDIGVITSDDGQKNLLVSLKLDKEIMIETVDGFQGQEKELIILFVGNNQIGLLNDWRRLNVALTRAKSGLIVIGNPLLLQTNEYWKEILTHCQKLGVLFNVSSLQDLNDSQIFLQKSMKETSVKQLVNKKIEKEKDTFEPKSLPKVTPKPTQPAAQPKPGKPPKTTKNTFEQKSEATGSRPPKPTQTFVKKRMTANNLLQQEIVTEVTTTTTRQVVQTVAANQAVKTAVKNQQSIPKVITQARDNSSQRDSGSKKK